METKRAFDRCKTCGEYDHTDTHRCLPVWVVSWEEDEDDREVRARDAEQATERFAEQYAERTAAVANFERVARQQAEEYLGEIELGFDPFDWAGEGEKAGNIRFIAEQLGTDTAILSRLERAQDKLAMQRLEHSLRIVENNLAEYRALPADSMKLRFEHASFVRFHLACAAENLRILGKKPEDLGLAPGEFEKLVVEFRPRSSEQCRELVMPRPRHSN